MDNGLLRLNEAAEAEHKLREQLQVNLKVVDASELFLSRLAGVRDVTFLQPARFSECPVQAPPPRVAL